VNVAEAVALVPFTRNTHQRKERMKKPESPLPTEPPTFTVFFLLSPVRITAESPVSQRPKRNV
jgi:hypothetical protein